MGRRVNVAKRCINSVCHAAHPCNPRNYLVFVVGESNCHLGMCWAGWAHGLLRDILTGIIMSRGNWTSIQTYGQEAHCVDDMMKLSEAKQYHGHDQHSTPTIREPPPLQSTGRLETAIFNRAAHTGLYIYGGRRTYLISVLSYTHWPCPRPIVCSADQSWDCHHCRTRN